MQQEHSGGLTAEMLGRVVATLMRTADADSLATFFYWMTGQGVAWTDESVSWRVERPWMLLGIPFGSYIEHNEMSMDDFRGIVSKAAWECDSMPVLVAIYNAMTYQKSACVPINRGAPAVMPRAAVLHRAQNGEWLADVVGIH